MRVRREVLGDAHVDNAVTNTTEFTADFQDFITRYAWGDLWARPGLTRQQRSMVTLALLAGLGRLAAHEFVAAASDRAARQGISLPEALLTHEPTAARLREAGIGAAELAVAADPAGYLGAAAEFVGRALAAHEQARRDGP